MTIEQEVQYVPFPAESIDRAVGDTHQTFTVSVSVSGSNVTAVSPESASVTEWGSATFTLTFASEKDADDITVTGGTVSGTTLTVSNVTKNTTVTIADKV